MNDERPFEENAWLDPSPTDAAPQGGGLPAEPVENAVRRLQDQLTESNDRYLRLAADHDNFRKRVARERIDLGDKAQAAFVIRLLDVLDDLDRLAATDPQGPPAALRQGVELVDRKLRKELELAGLERLDPVGLKFDPAVAEAVSIIPPPAPEQDHQVASTFQVGYKFKGALVRPAMVQVYSAGGQA